MTPNQTNARTCVFCGSAANSREHVIAKRLFHRAGANELTVLAGLYNEAKGTVTRTPHGLDAFKVRHVCTTCNNTWMNDLEEWFERRVGCLIEPTWPKLALPMIDVLKEERVQLAHWLMKTAITFNLAAVKGDLRIDFPGEVMRQVQEGKLPDRCWIDLAYSKLPTVGGTLSKCWRVFNGGHYNPSQIFSGLGFRFTVQFNHLLLRIARAPNADVTYERPNGALPVRLYPDPIATTPELFVFNDIMQFEHSLVLETWKGCPGGIPAHPTRR